MNPVLIEVTRAGLVESCHRGALALVDSAGRLQAALGDIAAPVFARSAYKPIQVLPLLEQGGGTALSHFQVALCCASHNGEAQHVQCVQDWLAQMQLDESCLACGEDWPMGQDARDALMRAGGVRRRSQHNCSGKHSGMLALCQAQGWAMEGYDAYDHPAQQAWRQTLSELSDFDCHRAAWSLDGCGLPALAMPLQALARAFAAFAAPERQGPVRAAAMRRVLQAIAAEPLAIAGEQRLCSLVAAHMPEQAIVKIGAEGVYAGVLPALGLGFAIKCDDGAKRGAEAMLGALLTQLQQVPASAPAALHAAMLPAVCNSQGQVLGQMRPSAAWLGLRQQLV